jgi:predicted alpha/beta superfamily hydrolase
MFKKVPFLLSLLLFSPNCFSQSIQHSKSILHSDGREKLTIESLVLNESKDIFIGLPDKLHDSIRYPLIVILEGEILFETISPLTKLMAEVDEIPNCIVVGIPLLNKHLDYAPIISTIPESGKADRMLNFYRLELFPLLDSMYNLTDDRLIWAHSGLAGVFCTYLLLGPDNQFSGILSSSPNLRWIQEYINKENPFHLLSKKKKVFYYLTFGGKEAEAYMGEMYQQVQAFNEKLILEAPENLIWRYQFNDNNNHFSNAIETYMEGLITYFDIMK